MPEFRSLHDRKARKPTAAETRRQREIEEQGLTDVYVPVEKAPEGFWEALLQATHWVVMSESNFVGLTGRQWWNELRWQEGWPEIDKGVIGRAFAQLVRDGTTSNSYLTSSRIPTNSRIW